jgi:hypothetical protein
MHVTPGTLAEFDIVLSISEEAINRQLRLLYDKKIDDDDLPVPTEIEGLAPAAQAKYLINHDLEIHTRNDHGETNMEGGISGHITCPKISFTDVPSPNDFHTARISFQFECVEGAAKPNSTYTEWSNMMPRRTTIDGWTVSWLVEIGRKEINNVMEGQQPQSTVHQLSKIADRSTDLITPHANNNDSTKLHPKAVEELKKVIDSRCYLVSSVFCLLDASHSFEFRDPNGKLANEILGQDCVDLVRNYFTG